jgi:transcriptional regulator with XRE-family HTH domain
MSEADLARRVGKSPAHIRRLLIGGQAPTLTTLAQVASSLGYEPAIAPAKVAAPVAAHDAA